MEPRATLPFRMSFRMPSELPTDSREKAACLRRALSCSAPGLTVDLIWCGMQQWINYHEALLGAQCSQNQAGNEQGRCGLMGMVESCSR